MVPRSLLAISASLLVFSPAFAAFAPQKVKQSDAKPEQPTSPPEKSATQPRRESPAPAPARSQGVEQEKHRLGRLVKELQRSPRSFVYLRSVGFTESDQEFEQLIAANSAIFAPTRIIRRDEQGQRQIPGWPAITLRGPFQHPAP